MSKLVVISGPSGVGKGTVVKKIIEKYQEENKKIYLSISCTTRNKRDGEVDGVDYFFISEQEFLDMVHKNDFLEYNKYGTGKYYGTPKTRVINYLNDGYDVILEIDINGYRQVKANYPDCIGIFVMPPSMEELEKRLYNRGTETKEVIEMRLKTAYDEINNKDIYDYIVVNEDDKVQEATEKILKIMNR